MDGESRRFSSMYDESQRVLPSSLPILTKTELTFDFHRLNILLLRSVTLDSGMTVARKIATATMTDAKIHATVGVYTFLNFHLIVFLIIIWNGLILRCFRKYARV